MDVDHGDLMSQGIKETIGSDRPNTPQLLKAHLQIL